MCGVWVAVTSDLEIDKWVKPRFGPDFLNKNK